MDDLQSALPAPGSEQDLILLAQQPGPLADAARRHLIQDHERLIGRLLHGLGVPPTEFDDARQAAVVGLLEALGRFDPARGVRFWIFAYGFVRREVVEAVSATGAPRPRRAGRTKEGGLLWTVPLDEVDRDLPDQAALEQLERVEDQIEVRRFLRTLPARQRELVWMRYWQDRSQADIARTLGVSRAAVHQAFGVIYGKGRSELAAEELAA
jgi:RNA polymerase sigma factor (sigma-70 family)